MKRVVVLGGTGFIGCSLVSLYLKEGQPVTVVSRNREKGEKIFDDRVRVVEWGGEDVKTLVPVMEDARLVINLVGEPIDSGPWTRKKREEIRRSRWAAGRALARTIVDRGCRPERLIQGSAVGYYGPRPGRICDESSPPGQGFLAEVCREWEESSGMVEKRGVSRAVIRSGPVLGRGGGIFGRLEKMIRRFVGIGPGTGRQKMSWIHLEDEVRAIRFLGEHPEQRGVFNLTAPQPASIGQLMNEIAHRWKRPRWPGIPAGMLRLILGRQADELLLADQSVLPVRLQEAGFAFRHPRLQKAVENLWTGPPDGEFS